MSKIQAGGCLCGAIRYEFSSEPVGAAHCHCSDCRKASGSAFATVVGVQASTFTLLQGEPVEYSVTADSGQKVTRQFCKTCGSQLFSGNPSAADIVWIKAGSLDDPSWVKPSLSIWTTSAQPWGTIPSDLQSFTHNFG